MLTPDEFAKAYEQSYSRTVGFLESPGLDPNLAGKIAETPGPADGKDNPPPVEDLTRSFDPLHPVEREADGRSAAPVYW